MLKATGIIRRIDELGRIVVPKELRNTLRIKDGTSLEIFTNDGGELVLKKYSPVEELSEFGEDLCNALRQVYNVTALVLDSDGIVAKSGRLSDKIQRDITPEMENLLNKRQQAVIRNSDKYLGCDDSGQLIITPVISKGDLYGGIVIVVQEVTPELLRISELAAAVLKNKFS